MYFSVKLINIINNKNSLPPKQAFLKLYSIHLLTNNRLTDFLHQVSIDISITCNKCKTVYSFILHYLNIHNPILT